MINFFVCGYTSNALDDDAGARSFRKFEIQSSLKIFSTKVKNIFHEKTIFLPLMKLNRIQHTAHR